MSWKSFTKSVSKATNTVVKETTKAADTVVKETTKVADTVVKETTNIANDIAKGTTEAYNYSANLAKDTAAVTKSVSNTIAKNTEEAAKQGINTASTEWKEGSKVAEAAYKDGAEAVQKVAEDAYKWLDANACRIGLNMALTMGIVAYFTPKPAPGDPGTINSTAASATWVAWFASQGAKAATKAETMVISSALAYIINEGIFLIPGVKGQINKDLMQTCLCNSINTTISNPILWATPAGVGVAVGSAFSPIIATLICEGVLPKGASAGVDKKAQDAGIKLAKDGLAKLGIKA